MEYNKETVDEIFIIGEKILSELQGVSQKKSSDLEILNHRYENLRKNLENVLNDSEN